MIDDFVPIVHRLDGRTIRIHVVGDVHIGSAQCDLDGFSRFLRGIESSPDDYIVIVGDVLDNGLAITGATSPFDETMTPSQQVDKCVELLEPVKDRILGAVSGNHEARSRKACDLDPLFQVFALMRKPELFRQNLCFIRVVLSNGKTQDNYTMLLVHGKTASKRKWLQQSIEGVDILCTGHVHTGEVTRPSRLIFSNKSTVKVKPLVSVVGESWVKYGGYAARNMYLPTDTSRPQTLELEYTGSNNRAGDVRVVW